MTTLYRAGKASTGTTSWTTSREHAVMYEDGRFGSNFGGPGIFEIEVLATANVLDLRSDFETTLSELGIADVDDYDYMPVMRHDLVRDLVPVLVALGYEWVAFQDSNNPYDEWLQLA